MSRTPRAFKQSDVTAAIKGVEKAGLHVARVEVDKDGKIVVITSKTNGLVDEEVNQWDAVLS